MITSASATYGCAYKFTFPGGLFLYFSIHNDNRIYLNNSDKTLYYNVHAQVDTNRSEWLLKVFSPDLFAEVSVYKKVR